jgi:hypothetical protein
VSKISTLINCDDEGIEIRHISRPGLERWTDGL